jgi:flavin reductase (DIM6/NTAB) family NADH-FMN oxidoreductase RutF
VSAVAPDPWAVPPEDPVAAGPPSVGAQDFLDAMARLGGGVAVVTTLDPVGRDCGLTVTAVASLSLDPPLVLVAVRHGSFVSDALSVADGFALTVLAVEQLDLAHYTARHRYPTDADDFRRWPSVRASASGALVFPAGVAAVDCVPYDVATAGDHDVVMGRVVETGFSCTGAVPLLHVDRAYVPPGPVLPAPLDPPAPED